MPYCIWRTEGSEDARPLKRQNTKPLSWAVVDRRLDLVQFLLSRGAAVELQDDQPWTTPRFWATRLEEPAIVQALGG